MDPVGREQRGATSVLSDRSTNERPTSDRTGLERAIADAPLGRPLDRSRRLLKPTRFDPPTLTPIATAKDISDQHAEQLAAAMAVAREEGLRAAQSEVAAAVAAHHAATRELQLAAAAMERATASLVLHDGESIAEVQDQAVMFAVSLAEELLGRELASCDDLVIAAVERAMNLMPDRGEVTLRLHAADLQVVAGFAAGMANLADRVALAPDPAVERGGCVAVIGPLRIDAQLAPALERVRAALRA